MANYYYNNWRPKSEMLHAWKHIAPEAFWEANGFTRAARYLGENGLAKILEKGRFPWDDDNRDYQVPTDNIPYFDHTTLYKNPKTKTCCLVYLPYRKVEDIRDDVTKWAEDNGFKVKFSEKTWYTKGTCVIVLSLPDVDIIIPD